MGLLNFQGSLCTTHRTPLSLPWVSSGSTAAFLCRKNKQEHYLDENKHRLECITFSPVEHKLLSPHSTRMPEVPRTLGATP